MNLWQETQDLPGRFHKRWRDYSLNKNVLPPLIAIPHDELQKGYAGQRLKIYSAEIDFGLFPFEKEQKQNENIFWCLRYHLLVDEMRRPVYQRLAEILNLGRDVLKETNLVKKDMKSLLSIVGSGKIVGYNDEGTQDYVRKQKAGLPIASDVEIRYLIKNKGGVSPEQRADALWYVGMKTLIFVAPNI